MSFLSVDRGVEFYGGRSLGHLPDPVLLLPLRLHDRAPATALDGVAAPRQRGRAIRAGDRADDPALQRHALARAAQQPVGRNHRRDRLPAALRDPHPRAVFRFDPAGTRGCGAHRRLLPDRRLRARRPAAVDAGPRGLRGDHVHHLVAREADPADPQCAPRLHDPAGDHRLSVGSVKG